MSLFGNKVKQVLTSKCLKRLIITKVNVNYFSDIPVKNELSETTEKVISKPQAGQIQAAVLENFKAPLSINNVEAPKIINENEVLIDVRYCGLNGPDILIAENLYKKPPSLPLTLGYEVVGEIAKLGDDAKNLGLKTGDKVVALNRHRFGGLAEQCIAEAKDVWKLPATVKSLDAVAAMANYMIVLLGLEKQVSMEENDMVLVTVGSGAAGLAAIDIASHVFRSQVIAVCATEERATVVREKGAFAAFKFNDKDLMRKIEEIAADRNIKDIFKDKAGQHFKNVLNCFTNVYKNDIVPEKMLRDDNFATVIQHLSRDGRIIITGIAEMDNTTEFTISGTDLLRIRENNFSIYRDAGDEVLQYMEEGLISPYYSKIITLQNVNEAVQYMLGIKSFGKVVIDIRGKS